MDNLSEKELRAVARVKGFKGCSKMSEVELIQFLDAVTPNGFNLANLSKKELWVIAKARGIEGYRTMSKFKLIETFSPDLTDDIGYVAELRHETLKALAKERGLEFPETMSKAELIRVSKYLVVKDLREFVKSKVTRQCKKLN